MEGGKNELKMRARCCFSAGSGSQYLQATFAEMEHDCGVNVIIHVKETTILPLMVKSGNWRLWEELRGIVGDRQ